MDALKIKVILGSIREGRFGDKPAKWIFNKAKAKGLDVELLDLKDYPLPLFAEAQFPSAAVAGNYPKDTTKKWAVKIGEGDGFIFVASEYNHGYAPSLKNAIDHIYGEWNDKPAAFVGYGANGGVRSVEQLKQVSNSDLRMQPVSAEVTMVHPWNLVDKDGKFDTSQFEKAGDKLLNQLAWLANALKTARMADKK